MTITTHLNPGVPNPELGKLNSKLKNPTIPQAQKKEMIIEAIKSGVIKDEGTAIKLLSDIGISLFEAQQIWQESSNPSLPTKADIPTAVAVDLLRSAADNIKEKVSGLLGGEEKDV